MKREALFEKAAAFLAARGARKVEIFGSYARGEQRSGSDLDVVVDFDGPRSLLDIVGMEQDLSDELGIKVDLLTERSISPRIIDRIRKDIVVVYAS